MVHDLLFHWGELRVEGVGSGEWKEMEGGEKEREKRGGVMWSTVEM